MAEYFDRLGNCGCDDVAGWRRIDAAKLPTTSTCRSWISSGQSADDENGFAAIQIFGAPAAGCVCRASSRTREEFTWGRLRRHNDEYSARARNSLRLGLRSRRPAAD